MDSEVVGLSRYAAAVRRRAWLVLAVTLLFAVGAFGYTQARPAQYAATAEVLIRPYSAAQFNEPDFTTAQVATQVAVMQSLSVATPVVLKLGLDESPSTFLSSVSAAAVGDTSVISVTATRRSADLASRIANSMARSYLDFRAAGTPAGARNSSAGTVLSSAHPPTHPSGRSPLFGGILGGVIGLVLGCVLAIVLAARDSSVSDESALNEITGGLPVLGRIPRTRAGPRALAMIDSPRSREALAYRFLATTVRVLTRRPGAAAADGSPTTVVVVSAAPGDGRTSVAANFGLAAAAMGQRVLLCDADPTRPDLTQLLGLPNEFTLHRVLRSGTVPVDRLARPAPGLVALGAQEAAPDQPLPLANGEFSRVVAGLAGVVDLVVVDTPPLLSSAESLELVSDADVVLFTVRERSTRRADVTAALDRLRQVGSTVSGVVVTRSSVSGGTQRASRRPASSPNATTSASTPVAAAASNPPTDLSRR